MTARAAHSKTKNSAQSANGCLDPELVQDLHMRLHCLEGHIRGIQRMLEKHAACEDLLIQTSAVRAALNKINIIIIEGHIQAYTTEYAKRDDVPVELDKFRGVLMQVLKNG